MAATRRRASRVTGPASWEALRPAQKDARARALDALSRMRSQNLSLSVAAKDAGTTPGTVRRYAADALVQEGRRTRAAPADRIYRRMVILTPEGRREVDVRSSAQASRVAAHWNAIDAYLRTGDERELRRFAGVRIGGQLLATAPPQVEDYARRGELSIDDIYPHP